MTTISKNLADIKTGDQFYCCWDTSGIKVLSEVTNAGPHFALWKQVGHARFGTIDKHQWSYLVEKGDIVSVSEVVSVVATSEADSSAVSVCDLEGRVVDLLDCDDDDSLSELDDICDTLDKVYGWTGRAGPEGVA